MSDVIQMPRYRFRGSVEPCAEVSRPVAAYRNPRAEAVGGSGTGASATLDIFDVIDSYGGWWGISAGEVDHALKHLGDVQTIYVRLNSPGGEAQEGVAIANLLRAHPAEIRVTVYGLAASAASVIAIAGDRVSMAPGSILMIHEGSDFTWGDAGEMRKAADALDAVSNSYADLYALKAGGTREEWRAVMVAEKWFPAADAVAAKLADQVGLDAQLPAGLPPIEDDDTADDLVVIVDVEVNPAARAAARRFDLSMYTRAPAALRVTDPPAASADGSTPIHEGSSAVEFSDEQATTMREALALPEDADADAIVAAQAAQLAQAADPVPDPTPAPIPAGSVVIDEDALEELRIAARAGQEARAVQLRQDRDDTIAAAINAGHIAPARREHWAKKWDADPEGVRAALAELVKGEPIFPVAAAGYAGNEPDADPAAGDNYWFPGVAAATAGATQEG